MRFSSLLVFASFILAIPFVYILCIHASGESTFSPHEDSTPNISSDHGMKDNSLLSRYVANNETRLSSLLKVLYNHNQYESKDGDSDHDISDKHSSEDTRPSIHDLLETRRKKALIRTKNIAAFLDDFIERDIYDDSWSHKKKDLIIQELNNRSDIGNPRIIATECKSSMCRLEFDFDSPDDLREFIRSARRIDVLKGPVAWIWTRNEDSNELLYYFSREGKLFPKLPDDL